MLSLVYAVLASGVKMFIYLFIIFIVLIWWSIKDYFNSDLLKNYSNKSLPLIKTSFKLALSSSEETFLFPRKGSAKFNSSFRNNFFWIKSFEICRARDAEKVLGSSKLINKSQIYNVVHPFLKTGLLTSSGEKWHKRRRMLTPAFHFDILKEFFDIFADESDKLVKSLKQRVNTEINIVPVSTQFTLNTICESAMGVKLSELGADGETYKQNIYTIGKILLFRLMRPWLMLDFVFAILGYRKELDAAIKPAHDFTKAIIMQRKAHFETEKKVKTLEDNSENVYFRSKKRRYAMMDTLLQAQRNGQIDDEGIIEETDTFTFEGHDTTSNGMTFTLLLLAHNPEAQEKIFEEMQEVLNDNNREDFTIDDFNKMEYLDRVVKESLRIYPPVPFISREFSEDQLFDDVLVTKGTVGNIHIFDIHRDPEIFPDPEKFDPDRFLPENCADRSNFAFIAFSAGMRNCIGQRFAMLELKIMLTKIISSLKISPITTREEIVFISDMVLRPRDPIKMKFHLRN